MRIRSSPILVASILLTLATIGCSKRREQPQEPDADMNAVDPVDPKDDQPQPSSNEGLPDTFDAGFKPSDLTQEAIELARSADSADHESLRSLLTNAEYLARLNTPMEYLRLRADQLQAAFILQALEENPNELALKTIDALAGDANYRKPGGLQALLLQTSGRIDAAPVNIRELWTEQLEPEADEVQLAVDAVISNGAPEAIAVWESAMLTHCYEEDYVIAWLRDPVLRHRQDLPLLEACERLLQSESWPATLKQTLVNVLFDYRPNEWYPVIGIAPPQPPGRDELTGPARDKLSHIAELALGEGYLDQARRTQIETELRP